MRGDGWGEGVRGGVMCGMSLVREWGRRCGPHLSNGAYPVMRFAKLLNSHFEMKCHR